MRDSESYIGTPVADAAGTYLGRITGGSVETGRWTVKAPDGTVSEYDGPDMFGLEEQDVPGDGC
jgi:hypothetical protein